LYLKHNPKSIKSKANTAGYCRILSDFAEFCRLLRLDGIKNLCHSLIMEKTIEEQFNDDLRWILSELKREKMTNSYSEYQAKFFVEKNSDSEPSEKNQHRIIKMLSDKKVIGSSPIYHRNPALNKVFELQSGAPIGYYVNFLQPTFNDMIDEIFPQKPLANDNELYLSIRSKKVVLHAFNNCFLLSSPNFNSDNEIFISHVLEHPNKRIANEEIRVKTNFHAILNSLNIKGEVRKTFFSVSKDTVFLKNAVKESELKEMGINIAKLKNETSKLQKIQ